MPVQRGLRQSLMPFALAIAVALAVGVAALVVWYAWGGAPRDAGQMNATETGPSRAAPTDAGQDTN
ncbi:MAG: hypothetical protein V7678_12870 [Brevundimonas sp.]